MSKIIILLMLPFFLLAQSAYEVKVDKCLLSKSLAIARSQVGVVEKGSNRAPQIDVYNKTIGNPVGSPYCQAGQYWSFVAASQILGIGLSEIPVPRNGLATSTFYYNKKIGKRIPYKAVPDGFIVWKQRRKLFGHIERIVSIKSKGWVVTIGFNVSSPNDPVIEGVFYKKRNIFFPLSRIKLILGIIKLNGR